MSSIAMVHRRITTHPASAGLVDLAIASAVFAGSVALLAHGGIEPSRSGTGKLDLAGVLLAACSTAPLAVWRRSPLGVFALTAAASVLVVLLGYRVDLALGPTVALYLLAASRERQTPWTSRTTAIVTGLLAAYLGGTAIAQGAFPGLDLLHTGLAWAVAWFAGERTRLRREQMAELRERAQRAEREMERERLLAAAEERARIARDLHDSAGHAISVIALRAGAARLRHEQDPALQAIEELARQTAEEIDDIVGALREDAGRTAVVEAPTGLASLDTLIERHASAGMQVVLESSGTPRPLGRPGDQAAYRILQEALTNAARHGAGSARVELSFGEAAVEIEVANPVRADRGPRFGGGHGLAGMRERAELVGGGVETRHADGTFRVRAWIPYSGHVA